MPKFYNTISPINAFPQEILKQIFSQLDLDTISIFSMVNHLQYASSATLRIGPDRTLKDFRKRNKIELLPDELLKHIFSQIDFNTTLSLSLLDKKRYNLSNHWVIAPGSKLGEWRKLRKKFLSAYEAYELALPSCGCPDKVLSYAGLLLMTAGVIAISFTPWLSGLGFGVNMSIMVSGYLDTALLGFCVMNGWLCNMWDNTSRYCVQSARSDRIAAKENLNGFFGKVNNNWSHSKPDAYNHDSYDERTPLLDMV